MCIYTHAYLHRLYTYVHTFFIFIFFLLMLTDAGQIKHMSKCGPNSDPHSTLVWGKLKFREDKKRAWAKTSRYGG